MPIIISCPTCSGQLRVSDDLMGRKVRCPACNSTFEAAGPPPAPETPVETVVVEPWRNRNLELSDDPLAPAPPTAAAKSAVEVNWSPESNLPEPIPRREREEDDRWECPGCGARIRRDARSCDACGERFVDRSRRSQRDEEDEDRPRRDSRRRVRRDWEPHRGSLILTFGIISVTTPFLGFLCFPPVIGLVLGIPAWIMGQTDRRKIREGMMDPDGEGTTQAGWICGIIGVCFNLLILLACGGFWGYLYYDSIQEANKTKRQPFAPPPGVKKR